MVILRGRRCALDVSCCVVFANRVVRTASSSDTMQIPGQAWHFVRCDDTPHFTLYTFDFPLSTFDFTNYALHSTLYTVHCKLHILHSTLHTPHSTLYTPHSMLYTLHSRHLQTLHFTLAPHLTLYTPQSTMTTSHYTLHPPLKISLSSHPILWTPPSSRFHSLVRWYGNREKKGKIQTIQTLVSQKCSTCLHSGSLVSLVLTVWF